MSEPTNAPSEQPVLENTIVQTPGAQPEVTDHSATLATLDQEQLGNALFSEVQELPTPEPVPAAVLPPETTPEEALPTEEVKPPAEPEDKSSLRRVALGGVPMSERQQIAEVARMIREGEAATQVEALQKMGLIGTAPTSGEQPSTEAPAASPETPAAPTSVSEIQATIDSLREQRKAAKLEFDTDEEERLDTVISQHERLLIRAELQEEGQQAARQAYQQSYLESVDAMEEQFPWAADPESPLYQLLDDKVTAAQARRDPALQDPSYILKFAAQVDSYGRPAPAQPVAKPPAPPAVPARVVGGGVAPGHSEARVPTSEEINQLVHNASKDQLGAALFR